MSDLTEITGEFGEAYLASKEAETAKKQKQTRFFKALTDRLEKQKRANKTVNVPEGQDVFDYVKRYYPGWRIFATNHQKAWIERDPSLMKDSFVNPVDKMVYARTSVEDGPSLDEEQLRDEDWWLWYELTEPVRQVRDPSTWTSDQIERAEGYWVPGAVKAKLVPPRAATPEELAALEEDDPS